MSESGNHEGSGERLVAMANDIGDYFRPQTREDAIAGIANHIQRFWTPRMRAKLNAYVASGPTNLDDLPRAALVRLNQQTAQTLSTAQQQVAPPDKATTTPVGRDQRK